MRGVEGGISEPTDLACQPDAVVFTAMLREHDPSLRGVAWRLVGEDLDDVMQTAYLRAFRAWPTFRGECAVRTWLHRIVYTTAIDHLRGRARQRGVADLFGRLEPDTFVDVVADDRLDLTAALSRLDPVERAVLVLVDVEQMTYRDAAAVLGVPEGTIGSRLHRARRALRRQLSPRSPS